MSRALSRLRPATALAAVVLLLGAGLAASWDAHHPAEHLPGGVEIFSPGAIHPDAPPHVEASPVVDGRYCAVCLLRTQTESLELPSPVEHGAAPGEPERLTAAIASPRLAPSTRGISPRGPPSSRV